MSKNYSFAQVFSFGILLALALWGTTGILEALSHHETFSATAVMFSVNEIRKREGFRSKAVRKSV